MPRFSPSAAAFRRTALLLGALLLAEAVLLALWLATGHALPEPSESLWLLAGAVVAAALAHALVLGPAFREEARNRVFRIAADHIEEGIVIAREAEPGRYRIEEVNPAFSRITGYRPDEVRGRDPRFLVGKETDPAQSAALREALAEGRSVRMLRRNHRKDGTPFWNDLSIRPVRDDEGRIAIWVGIVRDVTAEVEAKEAERRLRKAVEQADEAIAIFEHDGTVRFANHSFCLRIGVDCPRIDRLVRKGVAPDCDSVNGVCDTLKLDVWRLWEADPEARDEARKRLERHLPWSGRHRMRGLDGREFEALSTVSCIGQGEACEGFVIVTRDITEMVELEAQLRHAQKMEAVGTLAAGIAHDFNNLLAGVLGNLYLVRTKLVQDEGVRSRIADIEKQGYRAAEMIRQMLRFARKESAEIERFALVPFVREVVKFARVGVPENIALIEDVERLPVSLKGDPSALQQALLNLITNARQAIELAGRSQGRIEVVVRPAPPERVAAHLEELRRLLHDAEAHDFVEICVCDDGPGMSEETRKRCFEPFFTTKPEGMGTGLGLSMVQQCVQAFGGVIDLESREGEGTRVRMLLPVADSGSIELDDTVSVRWRPGDGELILVADDDATVRRTLRDILGQAGYEVCTARNGEEAVRLGSEKPVALALLDVVMPRMNGVQAAGLLRTARPDLPVVFMTGYAREGELVRAFEGERPPLIRKPWKTDRLLALVGEQLHPAGEDASV